MLIFMLGNIFILYEQCYYLNIDVKYQVGCLKVNVFFN